MIRRPPRSTLSSSSAASDVYKRQIIVRRAQSAPNHHRYNNFSFQLSLWDTVVQKNSKSSSYDARAGNQCRRVAELLPYIATGNARNESAESHCRIEVAVRGSLISIFNESREVRALHTVSKCRENPDEQKPNN